MKKSYLERASWIAGIIGAALTLVFGCYQFNQPGGSGVNTITGNQGPVVLTQSSPNSTVIVNMPPERKKSDQDNCLDGERWVGMTPNHADWTGQIPVDKFSKTTFHGEFRWSPEVNNRKSTTRGYVRLEVDGKTNVIHEWNNPVEATHEFSIPIGQYLVSTSGKYKIKWTYFSGSSGICIAKSEMS